MYLIIVLPLIIVFISVYWLFYRRQWFINTFSKRKTELKTYKKGHCLIHNGLPFHSHFKSVSRPRIPLETGWDFRFAGDTSRIKVSLPYCFNTASSPRPDYEGWVYYEKVLIISEYPDLKTHNGAIHLVFEGSFYRTIVYINDERVCDNYGGHLPFRMDISRYFAQDGESIRLKVKVSNKVNTHSVPPLLYPNHPMGFHPYGGIHKPVYLEIMPKIYCFKAHLTPSVRDDTGIVNMCVMFNDKDGKNSLVHFNLKVFDSDNKKLIDSIVPIYYESDIGFGTTTININEPKLWNQSTPHLYTVEVSTSYEKLTTTFGFSSLRIKNGGFWHNDKRILLKGVCRHEEDVQTGAAQSHDMMDKDIALAKELGLNYLRLTHYPHASYFLDRCDEEGLLLWEEIALYQAGLSPVKYLADKSKDRRDNVILRIIRIPFMIFRTRQLTGKKILSRAYDDLVRMIERDYNHPSIVFWGIGNECWSFNPAGGKALSRLKEVVTMMDPNRIAGYAAMTIPKITAHWEKSFEIMDFIGVNEYFGWYYGKVQDVKPFLNTLHKKYPDKPILVTETGSDSAYGLRESSETNPPQRGVSEDYQAYYLMTQYKLMNQVPNFSGFSIWVLKDFLCPEYGQDNIIANYNLKGLVSKDYEKKLAFFSVKNMYSRRIYHVKQGRKA